MVTAKDKFPQLTPEEYFAWEEKQLEKHEYINGKVYLIGGNTRTSSSVNHGRIAIRLTAMFDAYLEGSGCITGNSDIKVNIAETENYAYPDASVTCDDRDKNTTNHFTYPCLIVEVLSDSTEAYDRGGKFRLYRNNPALKDYLLVSSSRIEMDLYHKNDADEWLIINYQEGDTIELKSINLRFAIAQIYRNLDMMPDA